MIAAGSTLAVIAAMATVVLSAIGFTLAIAALRARALFVAGISAVLVAATASAALLVNGATLAAIALAIVGAALLLLWVLGGMLLSGNSVRAARRGLPLLPLMAIVAAMGLVVALVPELTATPASMIAEPTGLPALLAALMFVTGLSVLALIGYGERGALHRRGRDAP